jgi:hypothetical protein
MGPHRFRMRSGPRQRDLILDAGFEIAAFLKWLRHRLPLLSGQYQPAAASFILRRLVKCTNRAESRQPGSMRHAGRGTRDRKSGFSVASTGVGDDQRTDPAPGQLRLPDRRLRLCFSDQPLTARRSLRRRAPCRSIQPRTTCISGSKRPCGPLGTEGRCAYRAKVERADPESRCGAARPLVAAPPVVTR